MNKKNLAAAALAVPLLTCAWATSPASADDDGGAAASPPQVLMLDTYAPQGSSAPVVSTTGSLTAGAYYLTDVTGTFALFRNWSAPRIVCGTPESAPMFPSTSAPAPGSKPGVDATVGLDAETEFARVAVPPTQPTCADTRTVPRHDARFQINTTTSDSGWAHAEPVGGPFAAPRADHTYRYVLQGTGDVARFSFRYNDTPAQDNYGMLRVTVRAVGTGDCKNDGWRALPGFKNQGDCVSYVSTHGGNPPSGSR